MRMSDEIGAMCYVMHLLLQGGSTRSYRGSETKNNRNKKKKNADRITNSMWRARFIDEFS